MKSNFFSTAVMKTSVISKEFRERFLSDPKKPNVLTGKAVVFEGPEDYHKRINSKKLKIDEKSILIIRGCGIKSTDIFILETAETQKFYFKVINLTEQETYLELISEVGNINFKDSHTVRIVEGL